MAQRKNTTDLTELLLQCVGQPDPMLSMLEWLHSHTHRPSRGADRSRPHRRTGSARHARGGSASPRCGRRPSYSAR